MLSQLSNPFVVIENPLLFDSIPELLVGLLQVFNIIAVPFVVFFIMLSGFKYVTARGNTEKVTEASRSLTNAIIGSVLIFGSVAIATVIQNLVDAAAR